jgi:hypothetical protein
MPDQPPEKAGSVPPPPLSTPPRTPPSQGVSTGPTINIADEFGTAKRNLPPAKIVLAAVAAVLVVVVFASFLKRAKPQAAGSLDNVAAVQIPGQSSTMVALTFTLRNTSDKILYVHTISAKTKTAGTESSAEAVSAIDFERYYQAFPALKNGAQAALTPETKVQPGETIARTVIVAFPVTVEAFNQRESTSVIVQPYDQQMPVVLTR